MTAKELKKARKDLELTQQGLADELEVSVSVVKQWETNVLPIPKRTELSVKYLLVQKGEK